MENITKLPTTNKYAFADGLILYGECMVAIRDKINEIVGIINTQFGTGDDTPSNPDTPSTGPLSNPVISGTTPFNDFTTVTINVIDVDASQIDIFYTTNGDSPTLESNSYTQPFRITESCTVKAFVVLKDRTRYSTIVSKQFVKQEPGTEDPGTTPSQAPGYEYDASAMAFSWDDPDELDYTGTVYNPATKTVLKIETLLAPVGGADDDKAWLGFNQYFNSWPNIISSAGRIFVTPSAGDPNLTKILQTYFRNILQYGQQENPGKYLGTDYIFDCCSEVYDTNYGIQVYLGNHEGWFVDNNSNIATPTRIPTMYQIYNDPDLYGGTYADCENYLLYPEKTQKNIIESANAEGAFAGDILINNAIAVRSTFKYGGSNCVKDTSTPWFEQPSYVGDPTKPLSSIEKTNAAAYYKLKLNGSVNSNWKTNATDTFRRVQFKPVVAQHDLELGYVIGIIRDSDNTKWSHFDNGNTTLIVEYIQDAFDNDYDPKFRFILQIKNRSNFLQILNEIVRGVNFGPAGSQTLMSVYNKSISPGSIGIGGFGITNVQNAIVDCIAESLLPFFGPQMPWESDMAIWKCDASIDNNLLNESWEWNNNVNPDQNYSEYLAIAKKRLQDKFNNDSSIYGDTINFNIEGAVAWNQPELRSSIKNLVQGQYSRKSYIRQSAKTILSQVINRAIGENADSPNSVTGHAVNTYNYALHAGYEKITPSEWNSITQEVSGQDTMWTVDKFRWCVYFKNLNNQYQHVYTCVNNENIEFFVFDTDDPAFLHEGEYSYGKISSDWKNAIKNWKNASRHVLTREELNNNCYVKHYEDFEACYRINGDDPENPWQSVPGVSEYKVRKFTDPYHQTVTNINISRSYIDTFNDFDSTGHADTDILAANNAANNAGWVDIFTQGGMESGNISFGGDNRIYGYIVTTNNSSDVSVGIISMAYSGPHAELENAAYSWALLLVKHGLHYSTSPLIDPVTIYRLINRKLELLSIAYYDQYPPALESDVTNGSRGYRFGSIDDVYFGTVDTYIRNTIKYSISGNNENMTRLSKAYTLTDWGSWTDLQKGFVAEGPAVEGLAQRYSDGTVVTDMPGLTINPGDILITLRNKNAIVNLIGADVWFDDPGTFAQGWIRLSGPLDSIDGKNLLSLGDIKNFTEITIPWLETIPVPGGMPDVNDRFAVNENNRMYGRFGGTFALGVVKANRISKPVVMSKAAINTLYSVDPKDHPKVWEWYSKLLNAKVSYRGRDMDRLTDIPEFY